MSDFIFQHDHLITGNFEGLISGTIHFEHLFLCDFDSVRRKLSKCGAKF